MSNEIQLFNYEENAVRTVNQDGEIWFVAKDVCKILGIRNHRDTCAKCLDEDERRVSEISTPSNGGVSKVLFVSESGLYSLIFKSKRPEAKKFSRWVRKEVLPQVVRTGSYSTTPVVEAKKEPERELSPLEWVFSGAYKNIDLKALLRG